MALPHTRTAVLTGLVFAALAVALAAPTVAAAALTGAAPTQAGVASAPAGEGPALTGAGPTQAWATRVRAAATPTIAPTPTSAGSATPRPKRSRGVAASPTPAPSAAPSKASPSLSLAPVQPSRRPPARRVAPPPPPAAPAAAPVAVREAPGVPANGPVPGLAIAVDNARDALRTGDVALYRITVSNVSGRAAPLTVTAILPAGLAEVQPADGGTVAGTKVAWAVTVPARGEATVQLAARVAAPPRGHRIALTACGTAEGGHAPQLCGTDLDGVTRPAGVAWLLWLGVGAGAVALATAVHALRRRRTALRASG